MMPCVTWCRSLFTMCSVENNAPGVCPALNQASLDPPLPSAFIKKPFINFSFIKMETLLHESMETGFVDYISGLHNHYDIITHPPSFLFTPFIFLIHLIILNHHSAVMLTCISGVSAFFTQAVPWAQGTMTWTRCKVSALSVLCFTEMHTWLPHVWACIESSYFRHNKKTLNRLRISDWAVKSSPAEGPLVICAAPSRVGGLAIADSIIHVYWDGRETGGLRQCDLRCVTSVWG